MRFVVSSKALLSSLSAVSKVVKSKNTISILNDFLFDVQGATLLVTGSDQETTITARLELIECDGDGKFTLNVKKMLDLTKELPEQNLEFIVKENFEVDIVYCNGIYNVMASDGVDYPQKEEEETEKIETEIPAENLVRGIDNAIFAASGDTSRIVMNGVFVEIMEDKVVFVATDTHKLVRFTDNGVQSNGIFSFILQQKPASILASIFTGEGTVKIVADSKGAIFKSENLQMVCSFIVGRYPNYNSVIPKELPYTITVDREVLQAAVRRVSVFADAGGKVVFDVTPSTLEIHTEDIESQSSGHEKVICSYDGEPMTIAFNKDKIVEVLSAISSDTVFIKLSGPTRPTVYLPSEEPEGTEKIVLLMPMMI